MSPPLYLPPDARNQYEYNTQQMMHGCLLGDPIAVKESRKIFHWMIDAANEHELHAMWVAFTSLADRNIAAADRKEGLK